MPMINDGDGFDDDNDDDCWKWWLRKHNDGIVISMIGSLLLLWHTEALSIFLESVRLYCLYTRCIQPLIASCSRHFLECLLFREPVRTFEVVFDLWIELIAFLCERKTNVWVFIIRAIVSVFGCLFVCSFVRFYIQNHVFVALLFYTLFFPNMATQNLFAVSYFLHILILSFCQMHK